MKNIQNQLIVLLIIILAVPYSVSSQDSLSTDFSYEVNRVYPYISITKEQLDTAQTLIGINPKYKPSWVREYFSVEILGSYQGKTKKAVSANDTLSQEQKDLIYRADLGTDILVRIHYLPDNTLKQNDPKEITFIFTVDPENEATYSGGPLALKQYLKENAIDKIPEDGFKDYDLAAVKFTVNEKGEIIDTHLFQHSKDEKIDALLLETVRSMPCWQPAEYANGLKVKQEFAFTVGNMKNCMINLLNIRRE